MNDTQIQNPVEAPYQSEHLLELRTLAGNTFKNLLDDLKPVLIEANIEFTERGLKLAAVDTQKNAFVHLKMDASVFEFYHCPERIVIGIDIDKLHRTIKTNKSNDLMYMIVRRDNRSQLEIRFNHAQQKAKNTIDLLSLEESDIRDTIEYTVASEMDALCFQNICREMSTFHATLVEIQSINNELIFENKDGDVIRTVSVNVHAPDTARDLPPARGVFLLKFLKHFAKSANLSRTVKLYLSDHVPLACEYNIGNLGTVMYLLSSYKHYNPN